MSNSLWEVIENYTAKFKASKLLTCIYPGSIARRHLLRTPNRNSYMVWIIPAQFSCFKTAVCRFHVSETLLVMPKPRKILVGQVSTRLCQGQGGLGCRISWYNCGLNQMFWKMSNAGVHRREPNTLLSEETPLVSVSLSAVPVWKGVRPMASSVHSDGVWCTMAKGTKTYPDYLKVFREKKNKSCWDVSYSCDTNF